MPPILAALKLIILYNTRPALSIANPKNFRENYYEQLKDYNDRGEDGLHQRFNFIILNEIDQIKLDKMK